MGTSATVRLIEGVRLIRCPLNTGFTVATMSGVESKEHNTPFDGVRFFVKLLILQWKREIPSPWVVLNILFSFDTL